MVGRAIAGLLLVASLFGHHQLSAQQSFQAPVQTAAASRNDYSKAEAWLCRPGRQIIRPPNLLTIMGRFDGICHAVTPAGKR